MKILTQTKQRLDCPICDYHFNPLEEADQLTTFRCNIRAFMGEPFQVWQCPDCQTIHCLDIVDLNHYYGQYPLHQSMGSWVFRLLYRNLCRRLKNHGLTPTQKVLDYGCGKNAWFVTYLQQHGFHNSYGYDPYGDPDGFGNPQILDQAPFDYIVLQEVIEHVEDPHALLGTLDPLLADGGHIFISTPNAGQIDLTGADVDKYTNEIHAPYHLHIYTRESVEWLGQTQGWQPVAFFPHSPYELPWWGFNLPAYKRYQQLCDGTVDVLCEPTRLGIALRDIQFLFRAVFGYWLNPSTGMALMFRKPV